MSRTRWITLWLMITFIALNLARLLLGVLS
jgi:hypothetical protein